ncbi:MAG: hypothetical protein LBV80_03405 [Deltaproteobacteria bacterium]|jgi:hypothetical protein|nr:hypothetical protein [Deltaproteobacteria bacterium]
MLKVWRFFTEGQTDTTQAARWPFMALLLCVAASFIRFPGEWDNDTISQHAQMLAGVYRDWHPPIFAAFWGMLNKAWNTLTGMAYTGSGVIYTVHVLMFWSGMLLLLRASKKFWQAFAGAPQWKLSAVLAFFLFLAFFELVPILRLVFKDTAMVASYSLTVGIILNFPHKRLWRWLAFAACLLLLFYGTGVRHNAAFAMIPLLALAVMGVSAKRSILLVLPVTLLIWAALLLGINQFTYGVLKSEHEYSLKEIFYNDIWKLNYKTKTFDLPPHMGGGNWDPLTREDFFKYFTNKPNITDSFEFIRKRYEPDERFNIYTDFNGTKDDLDALREFWFTKVSQHPGKYLQHRRVFFMDLMRNFSFMTQIGLVYLVFSCAILLHFTVKVVRRKTPANLVPYFMVTSGLLYVLPYFFIAPAMQRRYLYWFYLTSFFGLVWFGKKFFSHYGLCRKNPQ